MKIVPHLHAVEFIPESAEDEILLTDMECAIFSRENQQASPIFRSEWSRPNQYERLSLTLREIEWTFKIIAMDVETPQD